MTAADATFNVNDSLEVHLFLQEVRFLPPEAHAARALTGQADLGPTARPRILRIIRRDPALAALLLSKAQSRAASGGQIVTLDQALAALSDLDLRAVCLAVANRLGSHHLDRAVSDMITRHSWFVAQGASRLAAYCPDLDEDATYTAGLVHDLGLIALWVFAPQEADSLWGVIQRRGVSPLIAEEAHGVNHQEIGISLAQHWRLPPLISEVLGCHHTPDASLCHLPVVCAVHLADCLAVEMGWGPYPDRFFCPPEDIALQTLDLHPAELAGWREGMARWADAHRTGPSVS